jgi:hypothetical protein
MRDFSLVPVDHQPEFSAVSLVPVDHDPFSVDGTTEQARTQPLATDVGLPDAGAPGAVEGVSSRPRPVVLAEAGENYPTADAAAIAALQDINPTSQRRGNEYAGRIYKKWLGLGDYSYTPPIEGGPFSSKPGSRPGLLLHSLGLNAGTYHTHTPGTDPVRDEEYSDGDKIVSDGEGAAAYVGTPSGTIYKYSPIPAQPSKGDVTQLGRTSGSLKRLPAQPGSFPGSNR